MKKNKTDWIFELAIFLMPFENFFFAPSSGWAAISPIIMFIYLLLNLKRFDYVFNNYKQIILFFVFGILITCLNWILGNFLLVNFVNAIIPIFLGLICLFSTKIYIKKNEEILDIKIKKNCELIFYSYCLTIVVGLLEFITIKFNVPALYNFFDTLFKRNYLINNRVQFFFTEPSFTGMHIFGILLPFYIVTKNKKILKLLATYSIISIAFSSSVRFIVDVIIIIMIFLYYYLIKNKKYFLIFLIPIFLLSAINIGKNVSYRFEQVLNLGIYADGSLAARYFRINSSLKGYKNDFVHSLIGYGIGNSIIPIRKGYDEAKSEYKSNYMKEVYELAEVNYTNDNASYCLYTRIISEYGFLMFINAIIYLIKLTKSSNLPYKWPLFITTLYLYVQFESLAFYSLWFLIIIMENSKVRKEI